MLRHELLQEIWNAVFAKLDGLEEMNGELSGECAQAAVDAIQAKLIEAIPETKVFTELH